MGNRTASIKQTGGSFYVINRDNDLCVAGPYKSRPIAERQARFYGYTVEGSAPLPKRKE